ncbi:hypothetical protein FRX31_022660 [Thalictrum thalictroides]|uniref:Uncharacterized protein n=1 Tax=Thalictrum thalictroides TaxID=46969 RepID=A0A7J6VTN3_THATH|nr:hypothetical protein FRX31_022660 [Thalictrum thalictroides]
MKLTLRKHITRLITQTDSNVVSFMNNREGHPWELKHMLKMIKEMVAKFDLFSDRCKDSPQSISFLNIAGKV